MPRVRQLTVRAGILGALLGAVTGASNLYVGLKTGWSLGVVLTASVLGWATWEAIRRIARRGAPMGALELNAMASTASAAGYSTGVNLVSCVAAYAMITGAHLPLVTLWLWTASVAGLGLGFAILVAHRFLDVERLPFPTGRAAAQTLATLAAGGQRERARVLGLGALVGAGLVLLTHLPGGLALPSHVPTARAVAALPWLGAAVAYGFQLELSAVMIAAGILTGPRIALSVALGTLVGWGVLAPRLVAAGLAASPAYPDVVGAALWVGVPLLLGGSVVALLQLAVSAVGRVRAAGPRDDDPALPRRWFWFTLLLAGPACVVLQVRAFGIPPLLAVAAIALALGLTVVAARVTGETDVTPTGPLGKVTQLAYGAALPGAVIENLMATGVTAGAATSAADLLTDLSSGRRLGADRRQQFWAQALGVLVGTAVVVPLFTHVLVPDPAALGSATWPAPAAQVWRSVAGLFAGGAVPPALVPLALVAALVGIVLAVAGRRWPWMPSPSGVGIGILVPASSGIGFAIGGLVLLAAQRRGSARAETWVAAAAGAIVGESVLGLLAGVVGG